MQNRIAVRSNHISLCKAVEPLDDATLGDRGTVAENDDGESGQRSAGSTLEFDVFSVTTSGANLVNSCLSKGGSRHAEGGGAHHRDESHRDNLLVWLLLTDVECLPCTERG